MMKVVGDCLLGIRGAVGLLTRIPVGCCVPHGADAGSRWAIAHLPLVGTLIGSLGSLVWVLASRFDAGVRVWLVIAVLLLLTGALHEDGLADTADALGGAFSREKLFEILKDSRIGSFGALALVVALGLRAALLTRLLSESCWTLIASQTVSRLGPVLLLRCLPYVTPQNTSRSHGMVQGQNWQWLFACLWTLSVSAVASHWAHWAPGRIAIAFGLNALALLWLAFRFKRRAGGVTGDFLGATQQVGELAFLLGLGAW